MFRSFGAPELIIVLVIVLIIFGVGKLPSIGGALGKGIREFKKGQTGQLDSSEAPKAEAEAAKAVEKK